MLDTYRIKTRIEEIRKRVQILEKDFRLLSEEKLVTEENLYAAAERHLEVAIQACLDIANHLVSALGLERPKKEASEVFFTLAKEKIIPADLAKIMKSVTGYRNIVIHEYLEVKRHFTYQYIQEGLFDLSNFAQAIEKFLEKFSQKEKPLPKAGQKR